MADPKEGETCDAFVPFPDRDESVLVKNVGPPLGSENEDR